ncbi:ABC transporter substrate-binding protein [Agromyces atrinae]|uniref:ABC transporter substrate-binding protein n=1 Tax=Agromyces atrinae TaxID=592376 RepID=A0A4Q2M0K5_9MICO|nr:ABC transporter substrate-binding protein [Agromyces atrinae]NYD66989.1 multiple sugar transport system substrate-binding protein [Agromyces atrinae]RXZ85277.1 ABC transporter substrate-binding protein [Agromyces atrinae]RXZ85385.1 ABC transporter substrate-binding protein [Agromyces atrinae]
MKKSIAGAALASAMLLALTGCSTGTPESDGTVELTFWHGYTEADGDVLNALVDEFNESQDEIEITPVVKPWATLIDTVLPALTSGTGPQLLAMPPEQIPVYASKGALLPLDDWYAEPESGSDTLNAEAVATGTVSGEKFGVPLSFTPLTMFYNTALFDAAGATVPTTWDEWVATAKTLTVDSNGDGTPEQYGLALQDNATVGNGVWPSLLKSGGGDVVTADGEVVVDSPENIATLQYWADAVQNDKISPTGLTGADADGLFNSGKAAMTLGGPWLATASEAAGIDWGIATIPAGPDGVKASALAVDMSVTSQASDEELAAAETFFTWFYQPENMVTWSLGSGWPPLTTDVTPDQVAENPVVAALTEQSQYGVALLPGVIPSTDILTELDTAVQKSLAGGDPAELLGTAQEEMTATLAD